MENLHNNQTQKDDTPSVVQTDGVCYNDAIPPETPINSIKHETDKKKKILKICLTALFIGVIAGIIIYTAFNDFSGEKVSLGQVISLIGKRWYYLLVLFSLLLATYLLEAVKITIMIYKTTKKFKFFTALNCAILGKYFDYVTPFGTGGQPFQMYYLGKHGTPVGPSGAIPIGSFFMTQFAFFVLAVTSFILGSDKVATAIKIVSYVGACFYIIIPLFLVVFSLMPKAGHKVISFGVKILTKLKICKNPDKWIEKGNGAIDNNRKNMAILCTSKTVIICCFILSLLYMLAQCSMPYFTLLLFGENATGITLSWSSYIEITKVTFFIYSAITFIPTPGNSGAADGTFYGLFKSMLTVAGSCFVGMMIWRIFSFYLYILIGLTVYFIIKVVEKKKSNNQKNHLK